MINQLVNIIKREAALFESFLELLAQQQAMIVSNDVEGLGKITALQQEKTLESRRLNLKREQLVEEIRQSNNIEGDLNVTRLLDIVDKTQADQLIMLRNSILDLHEKINSTRDQNAMLLNRSRMYIRKMMEMLSKVGSPQADYGPAAKSPQQCPSVGIDRRA